LQRQIPAHLLRLWPNHFRGKYGSPGVGGWQIRRILRLEEMEREHFLLARNDLAAGYSNLIYGSGAPLSHSLWL